jgi:hypothetical protein
MMSDNSTENILRFMQLRGARPLSDVELVDLSLNDKSPLAMQLIAAEQRERAKIADTFLRNYDLSKLTESEIAQHILTTLKDIRAKGENVQDLGNYVGSNKTELGRIRDSASDVLLATKLTNWAPPQFLTVERLFRGSTALLNPSSSTSIGEYYTRAISLPRTLCSFRQTVNNNNQAKQVPEAQAPPPVDRHQEKILPEQINDVLIELWSLARPDTLQLPTEGVDSDPELMFSLNELGMNLLTSDAKAVLEKLGLQPDKYPIDFVVRTLEGELVRSVTRSEQRNSFQTVLKEIHEDRPYIKDVGVADLLVVKQHLKSYDRVDIAHIENILAHERKTRTHRALERTEETFRIERETTQERETELETAERFELNKESSRTVKRDQEFGFGLTLSGKYGPTVEFSSNLTASSSSSTEESTKSALRYSKDIMERSLERIVERVRTEHERKLIREMEETNLHDLDNKDEDHISGVYQFLEKVYESQIFNYGIRQMFDFMVPEPASYIWHLEKTETKLDLPDPPLDFHKIIPAADWITRANYLKWAAMFRVDGVEQPPPFFVVVSNSLNEGTGNEAGQPHNAKEAEIAVPAGYAPLGAQIRVSALTDNNQPVGEDPADAKRLAISLAVGKTGKLWQPTTFVQVGKEVSDSKDYWMAHELLTLSLFPAVIGYDQQSKLKMTAVAFETNTYNIVGEVSFTMLPETYKAWQVKTYDKFLAAHLENVQKYEAKVAELKAEAEAKARNENVRFGDPPSQNVMTVKRELKKHCISIVTRERFERNNGMDDLDPPIFDFLEAAEHGLHTRFFEQAFEWDQMQYVFYPYFWARKEKWVPMFMRNEVDTQFLEFLQAGSARVVVPVRPGFEHAITHYLETGNIWNESGDPDIHDPLYVPIIDEIKRRTGASQGEFREGDPWETRIPTPLVILRKRREGLPRWRKKHGKDWEWEEDDEE